MTAPDLICRLVEQFQSNLAHYRSPRYNETETRSEFIDQFFKALGWDLYNDSNAAPDYKDVLREETRPQEGSSKKPDYTFRAGKDAKFFVEAKKPFVKIESDLSPALQVRSYAWSAKLPISVLTDFDEFAAYDCRFRPEKTDKPTKGRVLYFQFTDYVDKWDEIASIFSREAVWSGAFDKFAASAKGKKGTQPVDDAFLETIEHWRELLARNIALRNPQLSVSELNYAVQMTIDRIVFLRICEARGIEPEDQLRNAIKQPDVYAELTSLFRKADGRYNSGLFHFTAEKAISTHPDGLTLGLHIDNKPLQDILTHLYYPDCPYVFNAIPADILGQVYEQFLGKVIRLTPAHQAKVEEKPEVRKAGGVYYTPTYIVDYIVKNTLGVLLEGKSPKEAAKLKVLDPACGSGTFLIGAYQYLLDWHLKWYIEHDPSTWAKGKNAAVLYRGDGDWQLTLGKKKEILLNNIFAVDIDAQAVEVAKLSLLLKVVENPGQLNFMTERILPDLGNNIQCGNSLIGPDYFEGRMMVVEDERRRVNPFDWQRAFPQVFAQGGFDVVMGNPPYIRIQTLQETAPFNVEFLGRKYQAASKGNYDIYVVFVEKGLGLLNSNGRLGFILPHKFFNAQYGEPLRNLISKGRHLAKVVHFGDQQVFESATTYTCLLFLDRTTHIEFQFEKVKDLARWRHPLDPMTVDNGQIKSDTLTAAEWNFSLGQSSELLAKLAKSRTKLADVADKIFQGLVTSSDPVYFLEPLAHEHNGYIRVRSKATEKEYELETEVARRLLKGSRDISRYRAEPSKRVVFPYDATQSADVGKTTLISERDFSAKYPKAWRYLRENYETLRNRENGKMRHDGWYGYVYPKSVTLFARPKLLTPSIAARASFFFDEKGEYYFVGSGGGGGGGYGIIIKEDAGVTYKYLLGLLNSRLLDYYLQSISSPFHGGYFAYNKQYIAQLPVRPIDFSSPTDKARHDKMVSLVERMLELHKRHPNTPPEQEALAREIRDTDDQIDKLVYELYGLTKEEIAIVEGKSAREGQQGELFQ